MVTADKCRVTLMGTKIEVVMPKADAGHWPSLGVDRWAEEEEKVSPSQPAEKKEEEELKLEPQVDALDLDDLEVTNVQMRLSDEAMGKRST